MSDGGPSEAMRQALSEAANSARQSSPGTPTLEDSLKNMQGLSEPLVKGIKAQGVEHGGDNLMQTISEGKLVQFATGGMDPGKAFQGLQAAQMGVQGSIQNNSIAGGANVSIIGKSQGQG